jgi:hypothetical protein
MIADDIIVEPQSVVEGANDIPHQTLERGGGNWLIDCNSFPPDVVASDIILDDGPGQPDDCMKSSKITGSTLKRALTRQ